VSALFRPGRLIVAEEERPACEHDRSAERAAGDVLIELSLGGGRLFSHVFALNVSSRKNSKPLP